MSSASDDAIDGFELADHLDLDDASEAIFAVFDLRRESGIRVRTRTEADGDLVFNREDVEAAVIERDRRREAPERDPLPPRVEFSDSGGSYEPTPAKPTTSADDGIDVAAAGEARGLSEDAMRERLIGRAKLGVNEGKMIVRRGDLRRLESEGVIPSAAVKSRTRKVAASIGSEDPQQRDPDLDRRLASAAAAIGMNPAEVGVDRKQGGEVERRAAEVAKTIGLDYPG